jgi:hypothetical protein
MKPWVHVGEIRLLQVQTHVMTGNGGYDTDALVNCERIRLTPDGVFGFSKGAWIMDRHHRHHPDSKYWHAENVLSFGFTSHYELITTTFRSIPDGIGGENVIVTSEGMMTSDKLGAGLRIDTGNKAIEFKSPEVAEPCVEFTRFLTERPEADAKELKPWREKLRHGVRGFVVGVDNAEPFDLQRRDQLFARAESGS